MARAIHYCDQCGNPRSRISKGLCLDCYKANQNGSHPDCTHHWVVGVQRGPYSSSVCKLCGDRTQFANYIDNEYTLVYRPGPKSLSAKQVNEARRRYLIGMETRRGGRSGSLSLSRELQPHKGRNNDHNGRRRPVHHLCGSGRPW